MTDRPRTALTAWGREHCVLVAVVLLAVIAVWWQFAGERPAPGAAGAGGSLLVRLRGCSPYAAGAWYWLCARCRTLRAWWHRRMRTGAPAIDDLAPMLIPVQRSAAGLFLAKFGVRRLPASLSNTLERHDLRAALESFCAGLGVDYAALTSRDRASQRSAGHRLTGAIGLLFRIDGEAARSPLDRRALDEALCGPLDGTERLLGRFTAATSAAVALEKSRAAFGAFAEFRRAAASLLAGWPHLPPARIAEILDIVGNYEAAQAALDELLAELNAAFAALSRVLDPESELPPIVDRMMADYRRLERAVVSGAVSPAELLARLATLLESVKVVMAHAGAETHASAAEPTPEDRWAAACRRLGLNASATVAEIKRAYRRLARRHHPDAAAGGSVEEFYAITDAYHWLLEHASA